MELLLCWVESRNNDRRSARNLLFCLQRSKTKKDAAVSSGGAILLQMRRFWRGVSHGKCHGYFCVVSVLRCFLLAIKISPCTRGRFFILKYRRYVLRFIPVRTGQIAALFFRDFCIKIHPRTHGADIRGTALSQEMADSSPYARGRSPQS